VSHILSTVVSLLTSDNVLVCDRLQNYSTNWSTFRPIPMTPTMSRNLWQSPVRHVQTWH